MGGDRAILLTDRALAGSDTLATARALSMVLEREQPDLIVCGRNSSDAETGQVGPGIAELMGLPHVGPVSQLDLSPDSQSVLVQRIIDQGHQVIQCSLPALVCVTDGVSAESFPDRDQMAEAATKPLEEVTCSQLSDDMSQFGISGSPTWVQDIRLVEPNRIGVTIQDEDPAAAARQMAQGLKERLAEMAVQDGAGLIPVESARYPKGADRSIWVVADTFGEDVLNVTLEILGKARQLTAITQSEVVAAVISPHGQAMAADLAAYGADRVLVLDNSELGPVYCRAVSESMAAAINHARPYAVLFAASADGRDLAARIAANLKLGLTGDAVDLEIDDEGRLVQLKPALGGNVVAPILSKTLPNLVTLRPGLLTPITPEPSVQAAVRRHSTPGIPGRRHQSDRGTLSGRHWGHRTGPGPSRSGAGNGYRRAGRIAANPGDGGFDRGYSGHHAQRGPLRMAAPPDSGRHQWSEHCAEGIPGSWHKRGIQPYGGHPESRSDSGDQFQSPGGHLPLGRLRGGGRLERVPASFAGSHQAGACRTYRCIRDVTV